MARKVLIREDPPRESNVSYPPDSVFFRLGVDARISYYWSRTQGLIVTRAHYETIRLAIGPDCHAEIEAKLPGFLDHYAHLIMESFHDHPHGTD